MVLDSTQRSGIRPELLDALRSKMRGQVLTPTDEGYDVARTVHNGMIDRHPAAIASCTGVADVMRAIEFAVDQAVPLSIKCGGHGVPGFAVCDDGVMIDLSPMNNVSVDPGRRVAVAHGGATWGQFDHETAACGLATTGGTVRTTGIAGLTLAGGHGFLMRRFGLACDNLVSAQMLTADGRLLRASTSENPDLFWALRGGGGNFGVVTSFEYRLHALGPILGGLLILPFDVADRFLKFYDDYAEDAPDSLGIVAVLATLPDGTKAVVNLACFSDNVRIGERVLQPLRNFATPIADQIEVMPYPAVQSIVEYFNPRGMRNYWKMVYLREITDEACAMLAHLYESVPSPQSHIIVYTLGGAVSRVPSEQSAVSYRDARHALIIVGMWQSPLEDEANIQWVRRVIEQMEPFASGGFYPNYEESSPADRMIAAFGPEKYQRLAQVKQKYDPYNVFRLNQNIQPATV
jgi:FAD/FMN-containing dehydrogenase